ncbi:MAG: BglII/BstYI family type II restriction endonuclease [Allosphingosinicella sp.]
MFETLIEAGFQVEFQSHAKAILRGDFPSVADEIEEVLQHATIPIEEIIAGGGGETKGTQRLRRGLQAHGWATQEFVVKKLINEVPREAITHKMDHVKSFSLEGGATGTIALEIEWNNKDPFYDRDLENFKRLHADGAISVGIIITRGRSLHDRMRDLVGRFFDEREIQSFDDLLKWGYDPTSKQRAAILKRMKATKKRGELTFREVFVNKFVADKFGEATTHWRKLEDRIHRGVGNPCPLVLIGLPDSIVTLGESEAELRPIIDQAAAEADDEAEAI